MAARLGQNGTVLLPEWSTQSFFVAKASNEDRLFRVFNAAAWLGATLGLTLLLTATPLPLTASYAIYGSLFMLLGK